jgi:endonuclease G, mitochondrial
VDYAGIAARRHAIMQAAADRWEQNEPQIAATTTALETSGRMAATRRVILDDFLIREVQSPTPMSEAFLRERQIGHTVDLTDTAPDSAAAAAGRPVARIVDIGANNRVTGFASGFLVAPGLLVTNWHVFDSPGDTAGCGAQFGYEIDNGRVAEGAVFELDPDRFFFSNEALDFAVVSVRPDALIGTGSLSRFGVVPVDPTPGKYLAGNPINIIQYPEGKPKRWATTENGLYVTPEPDDLFLQYATDTEPGSSGSPAFNHNWSLVAVHHSGVPRRVNGRIVTRTGAVWDSTMPDDDIDWIANEGVRISKIYSFLSNTRMSDPAQQNLLTQFLGQIPSPSGLVAPMAAETAAPARADRIDRQPIASTPTTMNIVVNGTANFYVNSAPPAVADPVVTAPPMLAPSVPVQVLEKSLRFDPDYDHRPGYARDFLPGFSVKAPSAPAADVIRAGNGAKVLKYHHYSLVMHKSRKLAMWTAANADYDPAKRRHDREFFGTDTWKADIRIPVADQLEDLEFYAPAKKFDRGHIVRRDDVAWGIDEREEEYGNSDSFHWTNCTPQHEHFNRAVANYQGLWGRLENHISSQLRTQRCILFAGPVLAESDPLVYFDPDVPVQVPIEFWKIVIAVDTRRREDVLRAYGFVLSQQATIDEYGWETKRFDPTRFKEQQRSLRDITELTGVTFEKELHTADPLAVTTDESTGGRTLRSLADVVLE